MPGRGHRGDAERKETASAACMTIRPPRPSAGLRTVTILCHPSILRNLIGPLLAYLLRTLYDAKAGGFYGSQSAARPTTTWPPQARRTARRPPVLPGQGRRVERRSGNGLLRA